MPKMRIIEPADYNAKGVPHTLQRAVHVLNSALEINHVVVRDLLDRGVTIIADVEKKFLDHPSIIVRVMPNGSSALTALGLIAGCVNGSQSHRLTVTEEDDGSWSSFGVMGFVPDEELVIDEEAFLGKK